jgi:carboxylate-amine ligase
MLIETSAILDAGHVYWDVRLGTRFPTLEFRIADACPSVDDAVLSAGLCRALVLTCLHEIERDEPESSADPYLLRAANWHAGRWGLSGNLIDAAAGQEVPAAVLIERLMAHVRDALEELGDHADVSRLALRVAADGNSATRQAAVHAATGSIGDVTDKLIAQTREDLGVAQDDPQASVGRLH